MVAVGTPDHLLGLRRHILGRIPSSSQLPLDPVIIETSRATQEESSEDDDTISSYISWSTYESMLTHSEIISSTTRLPTVVDYSLNSGEWRVARVFVKYPQSIPSLIYIRENGEVNVDDLAGILNEDRNYCKSLARIMKDSGLVQVSTRGRFALSELGDKVSRRLCDLLLAGPQ